MDQAVACRREHIEAYLLQCDAGYEILDAMVQANVNLDKIGLDELRRLLTDLGFGAFKRKRA